MGDMNAIFADLVLRTADGSLGLESQEARDSSDNYTYLPSAVNGGVDLPLGIGGQVDNSTDGKFSKDLTAAVDKAPDQCVPKEHVVLYSSYEPEKEYRDSTPFSRCNSSDLQNKEEPDVRPGPVIEVDEEGYPHYVYKKPDEVPGSYSDVSNNNSNNSVRYGAQPVGFAYGDDVNALVALPSLNSLRMSNPTMYARVRRAFMKKSSHLPIFLTGVPGIWHPRSDAVGRPETHPPWFDDSSTVSLTRSERKFIESNGKYRLGINESPWFKSSTLDDTLLGRRVEESVPSRHSAD
jgi:hypothetical protein